MSLDGVILYIFITPDNYTRLSGVPAGFLTQAQFAKYGIFDQDLECMKLTLFQVQCTKIIYHKKTQVQFFRSRYKNLVLSAPKRLIN